MKNEPSEFSIDHLKEAKVGKWDGIRNYQARNLMKDMKVGDKAFFYHSSCPQPGIYGSMTIHREHFPDPGALDKKNDYYDPKATLEKNPWVCVDVAFVEKFENPLLLDEIRKIELGTCRLTAKGNRLSVIPVTEEQYRMLEKAVRKINPIVGVASHDSVLAEKNPMVEDSPAISDAVAQTVDPVAAVASMQNQGKKRQKAKVSNHCEDLEAVTETKNKKRQKR